MVKPRASKSSVERINEHTYHVLVRSSPIDGDANTEVIEVLSEYFNIPKSLITIIKGVTSKRKIIEIDK